MDHTAKGAPAGPARRTRTYFKAIREGNDGVVILRYYQDDVGREFVVGPVARFDAPDLDPAGLARASRYLYFLNDHADEWPYAHDPYERVLRGSPSR
jgi:hypothetical protein